MALKQIVGPVVTSALTFLLPHTFYFIILAMHNNHAVHVCVCVHVHAVYVCMCVCVCMRACIHAHTYTHTHTHTCRRDQLNFITLLFLFYSSSPHSVSLKSSITTVALFGSVFIDICPLT